MLIQSLRNHKHTSVCLQTSRRPKSNRKTARNVNIHPLKSCVQAASQILSNNQNVTIPPTSMSKRKAKRLRQARNRLQRAAQKTSLFTLNNQTVSLSAIQPQPPDTANLKNLNSGSFLKSRNIKLLGLGLGIAAMATSMFFLNNSIKAQSIKNEHSKNLLADKNCIEALDVAKNMWPYYNNEILNTIVQSCVTTDINIAEQAVSQMHFNTNEGLSIIASHHLSRGEFAKAYDWAIQLKDVSSMNKALEAIAINVKCLKEQPVIANQALNQMSHYTKENVYEFLVGHYLSIGQPEKALDNALLIDYVYSRDKALQTIVKNPDCVKSHSNIIEMAFSHISNHLLLELRKEIIEIEIKNLLEEGDCHAALDKAIQISDNYYKTNALFNIVENKNCRENHYDIITTAVSLLSVNKDKVCEDLINYYLPNKDYEMVIKMAFSLSILEEAILTDLAGILTNPKVLEEYSNSILIAFTERAEKVGCSYSMSEQYLSPIIHLRYNQDYANFQWLQKAHNQANDIKKKLNC